MNNARLGYGMSANTRVFILSNPQDLRKHKNLTSSSCSDPHATHWSLGAQTPSMCGSPEMCGHQKGKVLPHANRNLITSAVWH